MTGHGSLKIELLCPSRCFRLPRPTEAMDLYLAVMSGIFNDRAHQFLARMIRGEGLSYMPLETVASVVDSIMPIMDEVPIYYTQIL